MRSEQIASILSNSIDTGKGQRAKNLKAYVRFFSSADASFEKKNRQRIPGGRDNEYMLKIQEYELFFDEWPWGILVYHGQEEDGTIKIEQFLKKSNELRTPWISKDDFNNIKETFVGDGGSVVNQRSLFDPYNDYSGYGLTLQISGSKTQEIMGEIEQDYAVHPKRIGLEIDVDGELIKFDMTNRGRLSFSRGSVDSVIIVIAKFVNFVKGGDEEFNFLQSRKVEKEGVQVRETRQMLSLRMPSLDKIRGSGEKRSEAIIEMLTNSEGALGYIGIPIGPGRANILDLTEHKMLQITVVDDELIIFSENPSQVQSAIRRLVSEVATHIDPDVKIEKISIGD